MTDIQKVEELVKKGSSAAEAARQVGIHVGKYYAHTNRQRTKEAKGKKTAPTKNKPWSLKGKRRKARAAIQMSTIEVSPQSKRVVAFYATIEELTEIMRQFNAHSN